MYVFWLILVIAVIFCIARYNESNKLFWTLLVAFTAGMTGGTAVQMVNSNSQSKKTSVEVCPTQTSQPTLHLDGVLASDTAEITSEPQAPISVSKDSILPITESDFLWKADFRKSRDRPPQSVEFGYFDTS